MNFLFTKKFIMIQSGIFIITGGEKRAKTIDENIKMGLFPFATLRCLAPDLT
jgi:hypothetical protein